MARRALIVAVVAVVMAAPAFAGDIVAMPTGNMVAPHNVELNGIWWEQAASEGPGDYITIGEAFIGVVDRIELDVIYADVKDVDSYTEVNLYGTVLKETAQTPSLIVGVTNLLGADWLPGAAKYPGTDDDMSVFALSSYNLLAPQGPPSLQHPLVRVHLGWGSGWHDDEFFGGVQFLVHPKLGGAILNYKSMPAYMLTCKPLDSVEATVGYLGGDVFYRVGGFLTW